MLFKLFVFTLIIILPLFLYWLFARKKFDIDYRKVFSYFVFASWFGMCGEIFLDTIINRMFQLPIPLWEYRILPIHNASTSSYGPIMWGAAAAYVCFYENYSVKKSMTVGKFGAFMLEAGFLMFAELYFDISGYFLFDEYFFYYFSPEFLHFSALVNIPFWWCGYKVVVKAGELFNRNEKLNIAIAIMMIIVVIGS